MCPSSGLWGDFLDCASQFTILSPLSFDGPQLGRSISVCSSLYVHTCTLCPMFSLDSSVVGLAPPCTCWRKDTMTRLCTSHTCVTSYLCHTIGEELVFFPFLYIKPFELGVEVAFINWSAVIHHKVHLLKFPPWSKSFEFTDDAFVLLICFCFFHLYEPLVPVCRPFEI